MITIEDLTEDERRALFERARMPSSTGAHYARRKEITRRRAIQAENFDHLIVERIRQIYNKADIAAEVGRWAVGLFNPQRTAVRRVAVGYKRRPVRTLSSKRQTRALADLYRRVQFSRLAPHWHTSSVALNRVLVVAKPRRDTMGPTLGFDVLDGGCCEVLRHPEATHDHPPAIAAVLLPEDDHAPRMGTAYARNRRHVMTIDARWFSTWDADGTLVDVVEHDLGRFPGSWMAHTLPAEGDAWNGLAGRGMTQTTLEVGFIAASMGWTRKTQCRKLLTLLFDGYSDQDHDGAAEGQVIGHPEGVFALNGENVRVLVNDLNTQVGDFLEHIDALERRAYEQLTGAPALPAHGLASTNPAMAAVHMHAAASEVHGAITEGLEVFERDFAQVVVGMAQRLGMPEAAKIDASSLSSLRVQFPTLPYLDTPRERNAVWQERIALGIADAVEARAELDGTSEAEAETKVAELGERQARLNETRAARHVRGDGRVEPLPELPGERLEAAAGRYGGRSSPPSV